MSRLQRTLSPEYFTNPNALALPPKIEFDQVLGMTKSMAQLMLGGKMEEALDTVKSNYKHIKTYCKKQLHTLLCMELFLSTEEVLSLFINSNPMKAILFYQHF